MLQTNNEEPNYLPVSRKTDQNSEICPLELYENVNGKRKKRARYNIVNKKCEDNKELSDLLAGITGIKNSKLSLLLLNSSAAALYDGEENKNILLQALHEGKPKNVQEASLIVQSTVLHFKAMNYLVMADKVVSIESCEMYNRIAVRLFRLHNETLDQLNRLRKGNEQKITVSHLHVNDGGKAIVGNVSNV